MTTTPPPKEKNTSEALQIFKEVFTPQAIFEELIYGSIAGLAICMGGHPFDTIKTRMQIEGTSLLKTITSIFKKESPLGFYKGIGGPLISIPALNALVFSSYEVTRRYFEKHDKTGYFHIAISGGIAGLIQCIVVCPTELVKCKMQMQKENKGGGRYKSSWHCAKEIFKKDGIRGINQGMYATIMREIPAYVAQFVMYEFAKREIFGVNGLFPDEKENSNNIRGWRALAAGAMAGTACWTFSFPPDVVKTRIQVADRGAFKGVFFDGGFWNVAKIVYKEAGFLGFFNGYSAILGRAMVANALGFWAWEASRKIIDFKF